ncbi:MFS transporter [Sulfurimonas aquatica]|uniref:MFS transporter n=1 Tax=Sulfurimonas aquatica TaxID=2672570 RepID=A0A975GDR7_9BACT|nr:MFS transporter [Sulfurimonas aquatica]QSZ42965.1 MFS transporter [Sulfurimonas aquatica]
MRKIKTGTKIMLLSLSMLTIMSNVAVVTMLPHLSDVFSYEPNIELYSRLMITLPSLAIALLAPFLGHLIHNFGKRRAAISALLAFTLFGTAGLYLETIYELLISRFFFGISIAVLMIVSTSLVGDYFSAQTRHKFMGMQSAFISLGGIVFIVGGGILSDINWRYPFSIYFLGLLVLIFVIAYLVEFKGSHTQESEDKNINSNLFFIYLLAFAFMLVFYILPTQMPFLMIDVFHASGSMTGQIIATAFVFNALGALSFSKLKNYFNFSTLYILGLSIVGIGFFAIGQVNDIRFFFLTSPIVGFGGGILMTNTTAWMLSKAHSTKRVKASAYLTSSLFLGQFLSPLATMPIVHHYGVQNFFSICGITILVLILLFKVSLYLLSSSSFKVR